MNISEPPPVGADRDRYDQELWRALAECDDPLLREMGTQLRDGTATPLELLRSAAYAPVFQSGLDRLAELDPEALAAELDRATKQRGSR
jgi:hypothetical protein